jgi:hypothetical protein
MVSTVALLLNNMLYLTTDVNDPTVGNKQKKLRKKLIFCWHLESHRQKENDPEPEPDP